VFVCVLAQFADGCASHVLGGVFDGGTMALPDQATFILEGTAFDGNVLLEANHHCNVGVTGGLCTPTYVLDRVQWRATSARWFQFHAAANNYGGIFTLAPPERNAIDGGLFPRGFVALCSQAYAYLLSLDNGGTCVTAESLGEASRTRYDGGILCRRPLRSLRIYSRGLVHATAPRLRVELRQGGERKSVALLAFHQIGYDPASGTGGTKKQGYALPVAAGTAYEPGPEYVVSLEDGSDVPDDWIIEVASERPNFV
jgi:hypothetical protein